MKKMIMGLICLVAFSNSAIARNDLLTYQFSAAVEYGYQEGILDPSIKYYLAGQDHEKVKQSHGVFKSNKKTNSVGKDDKKACDWVLLSTLKSFQERAKSLGANAVINIKSNYKNREFVSNEVYQCGAGNILTGVALKGEVVAL
ncbi:MAG: hypothetical protein R3E90_10860 [Marinicella sp.]|nr:excinuclease ATPase subunit [Xanthomonadales bacterium]